ncbi:MAG TPA: hypothetical protein VFD31_03035 [Thermoleophilaceae bacterium]|nr:hypothetical protein [Thermoleophilaceae bacterium]
MAVTVCADDLAPIDLFRDPPQRIAMSDEHRDLRSLRLHMVELEHHRIGKPAVRARARSQQPDHIAARQFAATRSRLIGLSFMERTAIAEIRAAITRGCAGMVGRRFNGSRFNKR